MRLLYTKIDPCYTNPLSKLRKDAMKKSLLLLIAAVAISCTAAVRPAPPTPRTGTPVNASLAKTWDAVIDVFANKNIPIKTLDRSSGFIVTEEMRMPDKSQGYPSPVADCGTTNAGLYWHPTHANYNIRVRAMTIRRMFRLAFSGNR